MRTLVAAPDEPPRRPVDRFTVSVGSGTTANLADTALAFVTAAGMAVTPWQTVVIRQAYAGGAHTCECVCNRNWGGPCLRCGPCLCA